jgi:hypothetical protein
MMPLLPMPVTTIAAASLAAAQNHLDGALEIRGHWSIEPLGKCFQGCGFGADQCRRLRAGCFPIAGN